MAGLIPIGKIAGPGEDVFATTGPHLDVRVIPQFGKDKGKKINRQEFDDAKQLVYEASGWSNKGVPVGNTMVSKEYLRLKNLAKVKIDK